jgi:uncharacterized protein DUF5681
LWRFALSNLRSPNSASAIGGGAARGRPFEKGRSGNPAGRPKGARNAATIAAQILLEGESEALTRKAVELALAGDRSALRLCMERILPPAKELPVQFDMPSLRETQDAPKALSAIITAVSTGELRAVDAAIMGRLVELFMQASALANKEIPRDVVFTLDVNRPKVPV